MILTLNIPVLISSKVGEGYVSKYNCAADFNPQKVRILLQLALTQTKDLEEIIRIFNNY